MAPSFVGKKFKQDSSENFEEYMKALGVNMVLRKLGNSTKSTAWFEVSDDGTWTFTVSSTIKTQILKFKLGEEVDEETLDGRKVKTVFTLDSNNVLTQAQKGDKDSTIVRTFTDTEMKTVLTCGDVVATRISKVMS